MGCNSRYNDLLAGYLDGELSSDEKQTIEAHLKSCRMCREELEGLAQMRNDLSEALRLRSEEASPSPGAWTEIKKRITAKTKISFWEWLGSSLRNPIYRTITPVILILIAFASLWGSGIIIINNQSTYKDTGTYNQNQNTSLPPSGDIDQGISKDTTAILSLTTTNTPVSTDSRNEATTQTATTVATAGTTTVFPQQPTWGIYGLPVYTDAQNRIIVQMGEYFVIGLQVKIDGQKWIMKDLYDIIELNPQDLLMDENPAGWGFSGYQYFCFKAINIGTNDVEFTLIDETNMSASQEIFVISVTQ